jgi:hypothetical protein
VRDSDAADGAPVAGNLDRGGGRGLGADAFEHRVGSVAAGQFAHALECLITVFGDDVGGAELTGEVGAGGVVAQDDDLGGAQPLGGDHTAQSDGAVADDGDRFGMTLGRQRHPRPPQEGQSPVPSPRRAGLHRPGRWRRQRRAQTSSCLQRRRS